MNHTHLLRYIVSVCLFLFLSICLSGRELYFSKITGDNGLSENNVKAILQDSYGFMWFGTKNGLDRYDGRQIKTFDIYDRLTKKSDRNVAALVEDDQNRIWIGTDTGVFIFDPITECFSFFSHKANNGGELSNWVADVQKDKKGNIWIIIPGQGIFKYCCKKDEMTEYPLPRRDDGRGTPQCIHITNSNKIWVGTDGEGLYLYDEDKDSFTRYLTDKNNNSLYNRNVYTLCEYRNYLVLGIHEEKLLKWDIRENILNEFDTPEIHYQIIRKVASYDNKQLLIATQSGLFIYNELSKTLVNYREDDLNPYSLSDNIIYSVYQDREGGIWVGTLLGGINYTANRNIEFEKYVPLSRPGSLSTKKIREMCEDREGNIWIGTENGGVNILNPTTNSFNLLQTPNNKYTNLALLNDNDRLLIGYFKKGMEAVHLPSRTIKYYSSDEMNTSEESTCALLKDSKGQYWLGNASEIHLSKDGSLKFERRPDIAHGYIYDIQEDHEENIWISTIGSGIYCYNLNTGISRHYLHDDKDSLSLSSNSVSSITVDPRGIVWFSTDRGGICCYNKKEDNFTTYSIKDGFPDNVAYKILVDKQYNFWFGTNKGLVRFNPDTKSVRVFTKSDGLLGNQFSYKSALTSRTGKFFFGGVDGLISFNPYYMIQESEAPSVYITGMYIYNQEVKVEDEDSPIEQSLLHTDNIKLKYNQSNISFDFAVLSYTAPAANNFAYKMEGIDRDWIYTYNQTAAYSKLPPGKYTFRVKGANNDGIWNHEGVSLFIHITPPWWKSFYAYMVYILLTFSILYYLFYSYNIKKEQKTLQAQKLFEIRKEHELYRSKVDFFTSIAHEIKTPLSLIKGPLEEAIGMEISNNSLRKSLHIMELNTNRLLNLINQLLDFRKIDANKVTLYYTMENITSLVKETALRFEPSIISTGKELTVILPEETLYAPVDKEAVTKIISNLLNNALKYTRNSIKVVLTKEESTLSIHVVSNGKPIPQNLRNKIFEPFYQIHREDGTTSGVGIGLSLATSLAELHSGSLQLTVDENQYNDFTLILPLHQDKVINLVSPAIDPIEETLQPDEEIMNSNESQYTVLVVDDNKEIVDFMADRLSGKFDITTASNGQEALDKLKRKMVHLIISDVMMPVMDGLELCKHIKDNLEYSHIPVILLTAKNDLESKLKGLEMGADAYLEKPFSFTHLIAQVTNLLSNREKERNAFAKRPFFPVYNMKMNKADEEFMNRVLEQIQENISDENFNVERLAELLNISRSALHRKIKNLVNMVPVDFIRVIRLKKAAECIQEGKYSIGEISVMVGINSPSYFSKLFQKQFGMTPKAFAIKCQEESKPRRENE